MCTSEDETELICETALFEIELKTISLQILGVYKPTNTAIYILTVQLDRTLDFQKRSL